jgi:hypothetical protein
MNNLPTLKEIYDGDLELKSDQNKLNVLLNQKPKQEWVKDHPFAKGVKYIPIDRVEYLLTRLFIKWRVEVKTVQVIANSCVVTVRLHYQNIEDNEWSWQDGIGAAPIQTEKGEGAMDWNKVRADSVMKSAPAAESYAVKDAAEKIGKIFGKDLNRKDEIVYDGLIDAIPDEEVPSTKARGYADNLLKSCDCYDPEQIVILEKKIWSGHTTNDELSNIIEELQMNQPKKF